MMHRVFSCLRSTSRATGKSLPRSDSGPHDEVLQSMPLQGSHLPPNLEALGQVDLHWAPKAACYIVDGVLSPNEADELRDWVEHCGTWEPAMIATMEGYVVDDTHRHHTRIMLDEARLAYELWLRICKFFPRYLMGSTVCCLNERLRFLKYGPGNFFGPHTDMTFSRDDPPQHSCLTLILYLSDLGDCCGGTTRFISPSCVNAKQGLRCDYSCAACVDASVKKGSILVFEHQIEHAGTLLTKGEKFVMRTDVMFAPTQAGCK